MRHWLQIIRWPNLIIVALTMYVIHFNLLIPLFSENGISPGLSTFQFVALILMTVMATGAGYIVNDWFDYRIDQINNPERIIINKHITWRKARRGYIFLLVSGALIASHLSSRTGLWGIMIIYNLVSLLLFIYAKYLKRKALIGNIVVALLCALVTILVWHVNNDAIVLLEKINDGASNRVCVLILTYILFSFLVTLYREIVKDMEDIEGDQSLGAQTLPVLMGIEKTKVVAAVAALLLGGVLSGFWFYLANALSEVQLAIGGLVLAAVGYSLFLLYRAKWKKEFKRLSDSIKVIMLLGILLLMSF